MSDNKKQSVLGGAMVLSVGVIVVTVLGLIYKVAMTALIGGVGRGYFNSAYELFTPIYALSMAGLPTAVARLVSESVALKRYRDARMLFGIALKMFIFIGVFGTLIIMLLAYPYTHFVADPRNLPAVLAIAPSLFFCCIMAVYRGYYEGLRDMKPTAVSQIFETIFKLLIGLGAAYAIMASGMAQYNSTQKVFGRGAETLADALSILYPICAAGAVLGVTAGSIAGTIYLIVKYKRKGDAITLNDINNSPLAAPRKSLAKRLIMTAVPMAAGTLILNITNLIDTVTIQSRLAHAISINPGLVKNMYALSISSAKIVDNDLVKYLWGVYGTALDFKSLMPMIIVSLGVSALPALSAAWATNDNNSIKSTIETVIRVTMLIALPAGIGIAVLATPILTLIYGKGGSADIITIAAPLVAIYGYSTALMSISTPIINMLQAIGRAKIPVISLALGATAKIICNFVLVGNPKFNINGAPFGSIVCYVIIVGINLFYLIKISKVRPNILSVLLKPLIASILCGISAKACYDLFYRSLSAWDSIGDYKSMAIAMMISIVLGFLVFAVSIVLMKGIVREDINAIPKGKKIAKALDKYGLLG